MSLLEGVAGRIKHQLGHLENITGVQEGYNCLSQGMLACVLKEKGAALVALGSTQSDCQLQQVTILLTSLTTIVLLSLVCLSYFVKLLISLLHFSDFIAKLELCSCAG
jgi:hypothetical protein